MADAKLNALEARIAKKILSVTCYTEREAMRCARRIVRNVLTGRRIRVSALVAA